MTAITKYLVMAWRDAVIARASTTTWNTYRRHMRVLFNYACAELWVAENPFQAVHQVHAPRPKKTVARSVLAQAMEALSSPTPPVHPGWFWRIAVRFFYFSGVRRRQLVTLRWRDVDFHRSVIRLRAEGSKTAREWEIAIPPACLDDLHELLKRSKERLQHAQIAHHQVFCVQNFNPRYPGHETTEGQVSRAFRRLSNCIGSPLSAHRLRHTMATELARGRNPDLAALKHVLGHTDLKTTLEYINPDVDHIRDFLAGLGNPDL